MKKFSLLLSSGLLAASFVVPVYAAGSGDPAMGMKKMEPTLMGWHEMYGHVKDIDYEKGTLTLDNNVAEVKLHFPPDSIKHLRNGSSLTVEMGFMRGIPGESR